MDLTIGAYKNELSNVYGDVINKPLHVQPTDISKDQYDSSKYAFSNEINDNLPKRVNYTEAIKTGARNLTDYLEIKELGVEYSINVMQQMLRFTPDYKERSLFDMAKLYEDEYNRVKGLTDITEADRGVRLHVLDKAFSKASDFTCSILDTSGDLGKNFDYVVKFTENAISNIQVSGLSEKTQAFMIELVSKQVNFYKNQIMNEAIHRSIVKDGKKNGWGENPNNTKTKQDQINESKYIVDGQNKIFKKYLDKIKSMLDNPLNNLLWTPNDVSNENVKIEKTVNKEISSEDNIDGKTSSEALNSDNLSEKAITGENSPEVSDSGSLSKEVVV